MCILSHMVSLVVCACDIPKRVPTDVPVIQFTALLALLKFFKSRPCLAVSQVKRWACPIGTKAVVGILAAASTFPFANAFVEISSAFFNLPIFSNIFAPVMLKPMGIMDVGIIVPASYNHLAKPSYSGLVPHISSDISSAQSTIALPTVLTAGIILPNCKALPTIAGNSVVIPSPRPLKRALK